MAKVKTLAGIARKMGAANFKKYAHNYGNERVRIGNSVDDAIKVLRDYRDEQSLISHFNTFWNTSCYFDLG